MVHIACIFSSTSYTSNGPAHCRAAAQTMILYAQGLRGFDLQEQRKLNTCLHTARITPLDI